MSLANMDPTKIPLAVNPSGAPPNFINPPDLYDGQLWTGIVFMVLAGVFVAFRLGTNMKLSRKLGLDDLLCISAFAGGVAYWALNLINSQTGFARHAWDVPLSTITIGMMKRQTAILFVIAPTLWAAKAAILALYIRVFGSVVWLKRTAYVWILFMALFYGMNIVAAGVYCIPRPGETWGFASYGRCSSASWLYVVVGVFSVLADVLILVLPFPVVLKLKVTLLKKVSLGIVFGTGIVLVALSVVSLYLRVIIFQGKDQTWNATALEMVTVIEIFGTVVVSCAPAMSAFWLNIFTKTSLWSDLKSSFIFSYLRSQASRENVAEIKPSFVHSSNPSAKQAPDRSDESRILRETTYEVWEEAASRKSSNYTSSTSV